MLVNRIIFSNVDHPKVPGISIYFQGCDAHPKCVNCHNPQTWEFDDKYFVPYEYLLTRVEENLRFLLKGFSRVSLNFLGGEPLSKVNKDGMRLLSKTIKELFGDRVVTLLYSWRRPVEIYEQGLLKCVNYIDEFVLGRYLEKYKDPSSFPATKNQLYMDRRQFYRAISSLKKRSGVQVYANHI